MTNIANKIYNQARKLYQSVNTVASGSTLFRTNGNWAFKGATFTR